MINYLTDHLILYFLTIVEQDTARFKSSHSNSSPVI